MLASSRKPCDAADPKRRAKTPALHCGRKRALTRRRQPTAMPDRGPMRSSAPTQALRPDGGMRRPAACLPCIVGRAFTPAGGFAAARKGIGKTRRRTPQSADADSSPYRGAFRVAVPPKSPLQGAAESSAACGGESETEQVQRSQSTSVLQRVRCGHRKPDGGCAARRRRRGALPPCPTGIPQTPAGPCPASVGDDAGIVLQTLQYRRPQAAGEIARPALRS